VALFSPLFLNEIPTRWIWIGMSLSLLGGLVVGIGDSCTASGFFLSCPPFSEMTAGSAFYGNFLALCGAWAVAGYLMIGRTLRAKMELVPYITLVYGTAALVLLLTMMIAKQTPLGYSTPTYLFILGLAILPQLIGHSTYNWALKYIPASLVSITTLGEPIGSAILAFFLLQEIPSPFTLAGGALILTGIYISSRN
jgi:drug/metabolite transporter (DMT)-like permease